MLLTNVLDIDPQDIEMQELDALAAKFGLFNMTVVLMKVLDVYSIEGGKIHFLVDETNYREVVARLISMAVMNFASAKMEKFQIKVSDRQLMNFSRRFTMDQHTISAITYLEQAKLILDKYENSTLH